VTGTTVFRFRLAGLVRAELASGRPRHVVMLAAGRDAVEQIVAEVYDSRTVQEHSRATARRTIGCFAALGALDIPEAHEAFLEQGLIEDPS
jgi:hypothetical protein